MCLTCFQLSSTRTGIDGFDGEVGGIKGQKGDSGPPGPPGTGGVGGMGRGATYIDGGLYGIVVGGGWGGGARAT